MKKRITSNKFDSKSIGVFSRNDLKTIKGQIIYWIFFSILVVVSVISVVPAIWTIFTAFKDTQDIYNSISFFSERSFMEQNCRENIGVMGAASAWKINY